MHSIERINSWLIVALFFFVSISTAAGSIISALVFIFWIIHRDFKNQFFQIRSNKVAIASLLFFSVHLLGILWSSDLDSGIETILKNWKFLMIPIFMLYIRKEQIRLYINAFLAAIFLSEFLSYLIWFDIIAPILKANKSNPAVFMSHIVYNPLLAIAIYIVASRLIFEKKSSIYSRFINTLFLLSMVINMFLTGGRTGYILFFTVIFILSYQYFKDSILKFLIVSIVVATTIFTIAFHSSNIFKDRVNMTVERFKEYESNPNTSLGKRITFNFNAVNIFLDNPIFGVGTGDLLYEMQNSMAKLSPKVIAPDNPHNNHLMIAIRLGFLGLLSFYWIFFTQIKSSKHIQNKELARLGIVIPCLFLLASFAESYFSSHVTSLFFSIFSALIFSHNSKKLIR